MNTMAEISPKLQIIISVLILVIAVVSFIPGPGILLRYSNQNAQPASTVTPVTAAGFSQVFPLTQETPLIPLTEI